MDVLPEKTKRHEVHHPGTSPRQISCRDEILLVEIQTETDEFSLMWLNPDIIE